MRKITYVVLTILMLSFLMGLLWINLDILYRDHQIGQADNETVEYCVDNFYIIEIDENDETMKIINGESLYKKTDNEIIKIKNPNVIINNM